MFNSFRCGDTGKFIIAHIWQPKAQKTPQETTAMNEQSTISIVDDSATIAEAMSGIE